MFSNYLQVQTKIIWESEVTIELKHCQCTYKNISLKSCLHFKEWGEWWRTNKGNITPPSSLPPPRLRSSSAPSAGGKHHFSGPLVAFHSIGLIVFLFICFTIDFSVEADVAVIRSDWLSWCDGWNKASKQTQCEISVTPLCVSAWVTVHVSVCSVGCLCLCLHLLFVLCRNASVHRFACMCVQRDEHCWGKKMSRDAWLCVTIALCVSLWTESDEVMFVPHWPDILVAAHCLFFSLSLSLAHSHTHLSLSLSLVAMPPLSVTSCVYLWLCARAVNVCSVCPISSPCCRYDRVEQEVVRKVPQ